MRNAGTANMPTVAGQEAIFNCILRSLPAATMERLWPALEPLATRQHQVIDHVDGPIEYLYFINRGLVSLIKVMDDGRMVEVGAVGIEGVTDPNALFGIDKAVIETVVQIPGGAFRIRREMLGRELERDAALRRVLEKYARFAYGQMAQTAACNRLHSMEERCCRWLLVCHDSALADTFPLTHELIATMLGGQRTAVTLVAKALQRAGLIDYSRGQLTIVDRGGLEEEACECYGAIRAQLQDLFPALERVRN